MGKRVALGLSGGVDSAVAAYLLKQQGYDVHCIYLNCFDEDVPGCRTKEDRKDALAVAMHLGLPFQVLDFRKEYQASVIDYFRREYEAGRTPNPDVVCNRDIKFGLFWKWAMRQGFDYVATGHYAKLIHERDSDAILSRVARRSRSSLNGRPTKSFEVLLSSSLTDGQFPRKTASSSQMTHLSRPWDEHKDQTYFLWQVPRERFRQVLFPLGDFLKSEVREIARLAKLPVADKPDSTGICFIGEVRVEDFLKRLGVRENPGDVVIRSVISSPLSVFSSRSVGHRSAGSKLKNRKPKNQSPKTENRKPITGNYEVIGRHRGVAFYTIGQRHGFDVTRWPPAPSRHPESFDFAQDKLESKDLASNVSDGKGPNASLDSSSKTSRNDKGRDRPPLYVIEKDIAHNRLIVGFGAECYRSQFAVSQINWLIPNTEYRILNEKQKFTRLDHSEFSIQNSVLKHCLVRIRHGGELIPCQLQKTENRKQKTMTQSFTIHLHEPQRGIAPGQSAVFYTKEGVVIGGGVIQ